VKRRSYKIELLESLERKKYYKNQVLGFHNAFKQIKRLLLKSDSEVRYAQCPSISNDCWIIHTSNSTDLNDRSCFCQYLKDMTCFIEGNNVVKWYNETMRKDQTPLSKSEIEDRMTSYVNK